MSQPLPDLERGPSRPAPAAQYRGHSFEPIFNLKITEQSMSDGGPSFAFAFRNGLGEALHDLVEADAAAGKADFVWVHLDLGDAAAQAWLSRRPWPATSSRR